MVLHRRKTRLAIAGTAKKQESLSPGTPDTQNEEIKLNKKNGGHQEFITHRIVYAIYGNIYHQYTPFMLAYIPYMDPMGHDPIFLP